MAIEAGSSKCSTCGATERRADSPCSNSWHIEAGSSKSVSLVQRLSVVANDRDKYIGERELASEAVAEIERLTAENGRVFGAFLRTASEEEKRLRAALTTLANSRHLPPVERDIARTALSFETAP